MQTEVFQGILIPFLGTTLGSACVLFMKNRLNQMVQRALTGFAEGAGAICTDSDGSRGDRDEILPNCDFHCGRNGGRLYSHRWV